MSSVYSHFQPTLSTEAVEELKTSTESPKVLAEKFGVTERTVYRYRAEGKAERRAQTKGAVVEHVKERLPRDLMELDKLQQKAMERFTEGGVHALPNGKLVLDIIKLRCDFLGWPKQASEAEAATDRELIQQILDEIGGAPAPDSFPEPFIR